MTTVCMIACVILGLAIGLLWGFGLAFKRHMILVLPLVKGIEELVNERNEVISLVESIKQRTTEATTDKG